MDNSEPLEPVINDDEFIEIVELLVCHGLHKDLPNLLSKINQRCPQCVDVSSPHKQVLSLLAYCQKFRRDGPLPALRDTIFIHTLHEGVVGLIKSNKNVIEHLTSESTLKIVSGLRSLLTRSMIVNPKFTVNDIERTVSSFFPTLPVRPSNSKHWENYAQILNIDLEDKSEDLVDANSVNVKMEKYFRDKLNNFPVERKKITTDEFITSIWASFADKFCHFVEHLKSLVPDNFLIKLVECSHPKLKLIVGRIGPESDEKEVIEFLDYVCDLHIESKFWTSDFVRKKVEEK